MEKNHRYTVATLCWTYNHVLYIESALKGFAQQKTTFPVIYIIVDDASTDGEQELLREWAESYLELNELGTSYKKEMPYGELIFAKHKNNANAYFSILLLRENHYQTGKNSLKLEYVSTWCKSSKYIALCEGDDFWTASNKLQLQVSKMEEYPDVDISAHTYRLIDAKTGNQLMTHCNSKAETIFSTEEVILGEGGFVGTATLLIRQAVFDRKDQLPFWKNMNYDYTTQIAGSLRGGLLYIPDCMSTYRKGVPGSFCDRHKADGVKADKEYNIRKNEMLHQLDIETNGKYHKSICARLLLNNIRSFYSAKENRETLKDNKEGLQLIPCKKRLSMYILCYCPMIVKIYRFLRYQD